MSNTLLHPFTTTRSIESENDQTCAFHLTVCSTNNFTDQQFALLKKFFVEYSQGTITDYKLTERLTLSKSIVIFATHLERCVGFLAFYKQYSPLENNWDLVLYGVHIIREYTSNKNVAIGLKNTFNEFAMKCGSRVQNLTTFF